MEPIKIAVLWAQMGPYHHARMNALGALPHCEVYGVELCNREALREWEKPDGSFQFKSIVIHDGILEETSMSLLSVKVAGALDHMMPDAVAISGYNLKPMRAAARWARKNGRASILMFESTWADRRRWPWVEVPKGWWIRWKYDAAFVGGERHADYLEGLGFPESRIWRGYDVVDNAHFAAGAEKALKEGEALPEKRALPARYFLYVGRFSPEKNLPFLLRAYREYRRGAGENPRALVLVGGGPLEESLREIVEMEKIEGVHFAGFQQIDALPAYYAFASCFVLPSLSEPWGLVVNEAMAAGLPVLVSDQCGCVPELVHTDRNGYVFDHTDANALTELMTLMASGQKDLTAMGEESKRIISGFTPESWGRALAEGIRGVISRNESSN